jgi:hypothetical protein
MARRWAPGPMDQQHAVQKPGRSPARYRHSGSGIRERLVFLNSAELTAPLEAEAVEPTRPSQLRRLAPSIFPAGSSRSQAYTEAWRLKLWSAKPTSSKHSMTLSNPAIRSISFRRGVRLKSFSFPSFPADIQVRMRRPIPWLSMKSTCAKSSKMLDRPSASSSFTTSRSSEPSTRVSLGPNSRMVTGPTLR